MHKYMKVTLSQTLILIHIVITDKWVDIYCDIYLI